MKRNVVLETNKEAEPAVCIDYCGSWGYSKNAEDVKNLILESYPKATFEMAVIPGYTGHFEVTVNQKLVHSKKNGDGRPNDAHNLMVKVKAAAE